MENYKKYNRKFLVNLILIVITRLLTTNSLYSSENYIPYYGFKNQKLIIVQISDSTIYAKCFTENYSGNYHLTFDTLRLRNKRYSGKLYHIIRRNKDFIFKPGDIKLIEGEPDSTYNKIRNLCQLELKDSQFKKAFQWTGIDFTELKERKWMQDSLLLLKPIIYEQIIDIQFDSLKQRVTSKKYVKRFSKVVIKKNGVIARNIIESEDSTELYKIWGLLEPSNPLNKKMFWYYVQLPLSMTVTALIFEKDYLFIPIGVIAYVAIIPVEMFVIDKLKFNSSFDLIFYYGPNKKDQLKIKIRNSMIICKDFNYSLPQNLRKILNQN